MLAVLSPTRLQLDVVLDRVAVDTADGRNIGAPMSLACPIDCIHPLSDGFYRIVDSFVSSNSMSASLILRVSMGVLSLVNSNIPCLPNFLFAHVCTKPISVEYKKEKT